jgi:spore coat polysaccharide biosynthesis protein SpsF
MVKKEFVAIIQARRGSSRFPDKVIKEIAGKPMLFHVLRRVQNAELVSRVILATTTHPSDKILANIAKVAGAEAYLGSADDVLDRYYQAAKQFNAAKIVRVTADCPVIDPSIIDSVIRKFSKTKCDYASNASTLPEGLGVEVFTFDALKKAWTEAKLMSEREHVSPYIWKNPRLFKLAEVKGKPNFSHLRLTVDYEVDLKFVAKLYRHLFELNPYFGYRDILSLLDQYPKLSQINRGIPRREGYRRSLEKDNAT